MHYILFALLSDGDHPLSSLLFFQERLFPKIYQSSIFVILISSPFVFVQLLTVLLFKKL